MVTINQLKAAFDKRNGHYFEEFTSGNYDDNGKIIDEKVPTLTTKFCEIGFHGQIIYLVFIAQSDYWSKEFFDEIKIFSNLKIYGFNKFLKDYDLTKDPELEIKSEPYFQMQFSFKNDDNLKATDLLNEYDSIVKLIKDCRIIVMDQLKKIVVS
jgi:hypothetical protein